MRTHMRLVPVLLSSSDHCQVAQCHPDVSAPGQEIPLDDFQRQNQHAGQLVEKKRDQRVGTEVVKF